MTHDQAAFAVRLEWGEAGARALGAISDVLIVVDVLSFSTAVDVAVGRGGSVFACSEHGAGAAQLAARVGAQLAVARRRVSSTSPYSLSPRTLATLPAGTRLVLPSLNGSTIAAIGAGLARTILAGCLRNASAVARAAERAGASIGVIPAGERWPDGSLRPAIEDLIGAGAIISHCPPADRSPESRAAVAAFQDASADLQHLLLACGSGRELAEAGFAEDVRVAAELNASTSVPWLEGGAFRVHALDPPA
jgi:2-phosphosulfolactate phosphatase